MVSMILLRDVRTAHSYAAVYVSLVLSFLLILFLSWPLFLLVEFLSYFSLY